MMTCLREKGQDGSHISPVDQFHDTDQLFFVIGADVVAPVEKSLLVSLDLVESLSIMGEDFSLPHRGVVIQNLEVANQVIVEIPDLDHYAPFLRPAHILARFLRQTLPPPLEGGEANRGDA